MGLFSMAGLLKRMNKISMFGEAPMSPAECANVMLNTGDARRNLPSAKADAIRALFEKHQREQTTRVTMDWDKFIVTTAAIYREFDAIAPLEYYVAMNDFKTKMCVAVARNDKETQSNLTHELLETMYGLR